MAKKKRPKYDDHTAILYGKPELGGEYESFSVKTE